MTDSSSTQGQRPPEIDTSVAHPARVWNYFLGGKDWFPADQRAAEMLLELMPSLVEAARADRGFLVRAVRHLAGEADIRQFLDIGTGLPAANNTHQVAQAVAPDSRIVYVDNDPLVLVHARALLTSSPQGATDYLEAVEGEKAEEVTRRWNERGGAPIRARSRQELASFFDGLELLEPGVVSASHWRPDPASSGPVAAVSTYCAVGRKP